MKKLTLKNKLINGECIQELKKISSKSVDMSLIDLPYGTTQNKWDEIIPFAELWAELNRVVKDNGAMVFTATQPFTSKLIMSNLEFFKYDMIWEKTISSGQLNIKRQPLRNHESIVVFFRKQPTYNEQKTPGEPYQIKRKGDYADGNYGKQTGSEKVNTGFRHAKSVLKISNPRIKGGHPTQKPLELMELLIKMYTNPGDVVLDCCMGSGTTGVAAKNLGRAFIGIELDVKYFNDAKKRIKDGNK